MARKYIQVYPEVPLEESVPENKKKVVVIGGGTGQPIVLRALNDLGIYPSAIVTMADDGGSSGRLREEMGIIPPGDVRNCLAALASPYKKAEAELLGYRFNAGEGLSGHALGNLIIAAFTDITGSFGESIKILERFLRVRGRVLPSTFEDVVLSGYDLDGKVLSGQRNLTINEVAIERVELTPKNPEPNPEATQALEEADVVILAPGSLFTSIIPNILVGGVKDTLCKSQAKIIYLGNVKNGGQEMTGMDPVDYMRSLERHGIAGCVDSVILHRKGDESKRESLAERMIKLGVTPYFYDLVDDENPLHHDSKKLAIALRDFI